MKALSFLLLVTLSTIITMSFKTASITPEELVGTKWISPVNDNCFESLCFTSEKTVMYYSCDHQIYAEVGFKIVGNKIEIEAYKNASLNPGSKLVLVLESGILRQSLSQENNFPKNFIVVPDGLCD